MPDIQRIHSLNVQDSVEFHIQDQPASGWQIPRQSQPASLSAIVQSDHSVSLNSLAQVQMPGIFLVLLHYVLYLSVDHQTGCVTPERLFRYSCF